MNQIVKNNGENIIDSKQGFLYAMKKYFISPLKEGIYGFTLVFAVILLVKMLSFLLGINETFNLDLMDVMLSFVGFFFMFLVYFLKKLHA